MTSIVTKKGLDTTKTPTPILSQSRPILMSKSINLKLGTFLWNSDELNSELSTKDKEPQLLSHCFCVWLIGYNWPNIAQTIDVVRPRHYLCILIPSLFNDCKTLIKSNKCGSFCGWKYIEVEERLESPKKNRHEKEFRSNIHRENSLDKLGYIICHSPMSWQQLLLKMTRPPPMMKMKC